MPFLSTFSNETLQNEHKNATNDRFYLKVKPVLFTNKKETHFTLNNKIHTVLVRYLGTPTNLGFLFIGKYDKWSFGAGGIPIFCQSSVSGVSVWNTELFQR